jgi:hypothetical protein
MPIDGAVVSGFSRTVIIVTKNREPVRRTGNHQLKRPRRTLNRDG